MFVSHSVLDVSYISHLIVDKKELEDLVKLIDSSITEYKDLSM